MIHLFLSQGIAGEDNPTYFLLGAPPNSRHSQSQRQNIESYDFVQPKPRAVSQQSVYEVPPSVSLRERGNGQEGDAMPCPTPPSRSFRGRSLDVYENTSIAALQQENKQQRRASDYDMVSFPARKATMEGPSYDVVPPPSQVPQVRFPALKAKALLGGFP